MKSVDPKQVSIAEMQSILQGAVAPRPIALASTIDAEGRVNLSPFSFFNVFSSNPPVLIFAPNRRGRDGSQKHTFSNAKEINEVVIHIVDHSIVEQMSLTSCEYPDGVDEFIKAGFTPLLSTKVRPPRIAEAKVAFECKVIQTIELGSEGGAGNLLICEVLMVHMDESILSQEGRIDPILTDWVARSGGDWYVRANTDSMFKIPKPNTHLGVGVDLIPEIARSHFSGNELGRLGNHTSIPDHEMVDQFIKENEDADFLDLAKTFLLNGEIDDAWCSLLAWVDKVK
jgi:flavin reductase (DIM6/NTAB) family NADH-FMN oxidoreductase RutF